MAFRRTRIRTVIAALAFLAASGAASAQEFDELTDPQRELLAPLAEYWDEIPAPRRERLAEMATRVADKPPEEQARFRRGLHRFMSLDDNQRVEVRRLFHRFRHLPPEERRRIIERVMAMPEEQRRAFALGMRVADRTRDTDGRMGGPLEDFFRSLPPGERRALMEEIKDLPPSDQLRRIADEIEAAGHEPNRSQEQE